MFGLGLVVWTRPKVGVEVCSPKVLTRNRLGSRAVSAVGHRVYEADESGIKTVDSADAVLGLESLSPTAGHRVSIEWCLSSGT